MKKIAVCVVMALMICTLTVSEAAAKSLYVRTIKDVSVEDTQDVVIEIMTGKNFTINEVTPYKVTFNKSFGDDFFAPTQLNTVLFNLIERDGNVKMMVSQVVVVQGGIFRQRSIDHLVPIIKEICHAIDGTPIDEITNEAVDQLPGSGNQREKKVGIFFAGKEGIKACTVAKVEAGSIAADAGVQPEDIIVEINARSAAKISDPLALITERCRAGHSVMLTCQRNSEQILITLKGSKPADDSSRKEK